MASLTRGRRSADHQGLHHVGRSRGHARRLEFVLVFDNALFSEYQTFLISDWVAHTPAELLQKSMNLSPSAMELGPFACFLLDGGGEFCDRPVESTRQLQRESWSYLSERSSSCQ